MTPAIPGFAFIAEPLDRADHLRADAKALAALRGHARCIGVDGEGRTTVDAHGALQVMAGTVSEEAVFLGMHGEVPWFAERVEQWPQGQRTIDLRAAALGDWPAFDSTLFAQARAVLHWRSHYRRCPVCGGALVFERAGWQGECTACGMVQYPRSDPAVIVAVSDGERLLLGRQSTWPAHRYSTLAGFVEPGESLEQTVQREVFEESRVRVLHSRYLASQPWPFPGSLMLGFVAHAEPDAPDTRQDELEDARWFSSDEVTRALEGRSAEGELEVSPRMSISRWLMEQWAAGERA